MTINGVNISQYGAKQHHFNIGHCDTKNNSAWVNAAPLPHLEVSYVGFKQIDIDFIINGSSREEIISNRSKLLAALMGLSTITLDNYQHSFKAVMKSHKENEVVMRRFHKVSVSLIGYEYGTEIVRTGSGSISASNPGTIISPVLLRITPSSNRTNVTITGLCRNPRTGADLPVSMARMTANREIVLDGANGLFLDGGYLKSDIDIKYPPAVAPGSVRIVCSDSTASLELSILPLYM